ncbi:MAG: hypothetical protein DI540_05095 [Sphingobium sp.]|nr:MAG: hypothetical protein DI540_05095 [Sphingobium sp.]
MVEFVRGHDDATAVLDAGWRGFDAVMQDRWDTSRIRRSPADHRFEDRRLLVIMRAEDLILRLMEHDQISEHAAARQVDDWLRLMRAWLSRMAAARQQHHPDGSLR